MDTESHLEKDQHMVVQSITHVISIRSWLVRKAKEFYKGLYHSCINWALIPIFNYLLIESIF